MMAQKESGVSLEELEKNFESQQSILWYSLIAGHHMANKDLTLKREDMMWVLDECYLEYQKIIFGFANSIIKMQEEIVQESKDDKKK